MLADTGDQWICDHTVVAMNVDFSDAIVVFDAAEADPAPANDDPDNDLTNENYQPAGKDPAWWAQNGGRKWVV